MRIPNNCSERHKAAIRRIYGKEEEVMPEENYALMIQETAREVATAPALTKIIGEIATLEQVVPTIRVNDEVTEAKASEARARVKTCTKDMERMRTMTGAPYRKMVETINNLFKPLKLSCERMVETLDKQIAPFKAAKVAAAEEAQRLAMAEALVAKQAGEDVSMPAEVKPPDCDGDCEWEDVHSKGQEGGGR